MRLVLSLFVSVAVAFVAQLLQNHDVPPSTLHKLPLQKNVETENNLRRNLAQGIGESSGKGEGNTSDDNWNKFWRAINRVLPYVVVGCWAAGRLAVQFRNIILAFLCLIAIFDFLLVQFGVLDVTVSWSDFENILRSIRAGIIRIGMVETISLLLGMWAGIASVLQAHRAKTSSSQA